MSDLFAENRTKEFYEKWKETEKALNKMTVERDEFKACKQNWYEKYMALTLCDECEQLNAYGTYNKEHGNES